MSNEIMTRIADAEGMLDSLLRLAKLKLTAPQRVEHMIEILRINELARIADAIEKLPRPLIHMDDLGPRPIVGGRDQTIWDWKTNHPEQYAWLMPNKGKDPFAKSLLDGLHQFGSFTAKQQQALDRLVKESGV